MIPRYHSTVSFHISPPSSFHVSPPRQLPRQSTVSVHISPIQFQLSPPSVFTSLHNQFPQSITHLSGRPSSDRPRSGSFSFCWRHRPVRVRGRRRRPRARSCSRQRRRPRRVTETSRGSPRTISAHRDGSWSQPDSHFKQVIVMKMNVLVKVCTATK